MHTTEYTNDDGPYRDFLQIFPWSILQIFPWSILQIFPWSILQIFPWSILQIFTWSMLQKYLFRNICSLEKIFNTLPSLNLKFCLDIFLIYKLVKQCALSLL